MKAIIIAMLLSVLGCGSAGCCRPEGALKYYEYRSTTMREYPHEFYRLERSEEKGLILTRAANGSEETTFAVPEEVAEKVAFLINEYKLYRLKETYRPPCQVLDGTMWHLYFKFDKGGVSCSADNAWPPKRLQEGIEAINSYLGSIKR